MLGPAATPLDSFCNEGGEVNGICVVELDKQTNERGRPVDGTHVSGIQVRGFSRFGILVANATHTTIARTTTARSDHYGVFALWVEHLRLIGNSTHDNRQGGFYVSDSPAAHAVIAGNTATRNATSEGIGLYLRDASHGVVLDNRFDANCVGALLVDTHEEGPVADWLLARNRIRANAPADAVYDGSGSGNQLAGNRCGSAQPDGLCG